MIVVQIAIEVFFMALSSFITYHFWFSMGSTLPLSEQRIARRIWGTVMGVTVVGLWGIFIVRWLLLASD